ncbi:MAG: PEP-CTERM sorting domain-containing protein [Planctomycetia bacterium]|nr:PEP-CTERM sorting domain-containing protein [Planctomycetia bacterium]
MIRKCSLGKFALVLSTCMIFDSASHFAGAATMVINTTTPTVNGADIALLPSGTTTTEGVFSDNLVFHDVAFHGQTFTTGANATGYTMSGMSALHFQQIINGGGNWNIGNFQLAVGTIDGSNVFTPLVTENIPDASTGTVTQNTNQWIHLTLGSTLNLNPNTEYAFVLGITTINHFGFRWTQSTVNSDYLGGNGFSDTSPPHLTLNNPMIDRAFDRIFHVDLSANAAVVPEPSTYALGLIGLVGLGLAAWRKRARNSAE